MAYSILISVEQLQALRNSGQAHTEFDCSFLLTDPHHRGRLR